MSVLLDLAARCEALDGRNNGGDMTLLTSEIARALGWVRVTPSEARNKTGHWVAPQDCRNGKPIYDSLHGTEVHRAPPPWLWSLDAAMTLVPEGWWLVRFGYVPAPRAHWHATLRRELPGGQDGTVSTGTYGDTPALALCAAALRARAALYDDQNKKDKP